MTAAFWGIFHIYHLLNSLLFRLLPKRIASLLPTCWIPKTHQPNSDNTHHPIPQDIKNSTSSSLSSSLITHMDMAELRRVFQMFDRNGDGRITQQELGVSLENLGIHISDKDLVAMIEKIDANGDGCVDISEFQTLYQMIMDERDEEEDMREAFNVFDQNGDGFITVEELRSVLVSLGLKQGKTVEDCKKMIWKVDEDDDEDAVEKIWEEEQFRKGLGKRVDNSTSLVSNGIAVQAAVPAIQQPSFPYPGSHQSVSGGAPLVSSAAGIVGVSRSAEVMSISQQADVATRALKESVSRLKETHGRTMSSMIANDENLSASLLNITALEKSLSAAGEKFIFMQKLRDFVSVICDFLQHKAPYIEELEEEMQKLNEERASVILERRAADGADEMMEVDPAVRAAMSVFSKGGGASAIAAAATAAQAAFAAAREKSNLPVQLDEFGRDVNQQKRLDSVRRAEARKRRKARAEAKRMSSIGDSSSFHIEGESSTDESDSETTAYKSSRYELLQTAEQVFSDAADEFSKLSAVKEMFETWKRDYLLSYRDAYMSLSVPAIFSPYVRLELLKWDPLYEDRDFNDMQWHSLLFDYGLPKNRAEFDPDDADADLIPQLVEKVALPVLHHEIAHCWDLLSTRVTRNAVSAMSLIVTYVPASSEALQELLATIHSRLADAVSNLIVPNWGINIIKAVPSAARIAAYRFGLSIRLLKNICLWKDILALHILEKLALDELLSGKVLPHIRGVTPNIHDAITRTERIIASLSGVWSGGNVTAERSLKLQPLVECVMALGKALEEKHSSGASSRDETVGLARRLKRMLVDLNEYDKARAILRTFQLKEAL